MKRTIVFVLAVAAVLAARAAALPSEAYVWQRYWTPELIHALAHSAPMFSGWRVLAAETDRPGHLKPVAVDWSPLAATGKTMTAVVRIDGHLVLKGASFETQIVSLESAWSKRHIPLSAIEIDYDCGVAHLGEYADFLRLLRSAMPRDRRLSITVLPAWIGYPDFARLIAASEEIVLQVHAVRAPQQGLFSAKLAQRWIASLASKDGKQFRVALPDYSTRVVRGDNGEIVAVESEVPRLVAGSHAEELAAIPADVAGLVRELDRAPPGHLAGLVWFRLPTTLDQRTWSPATLAAVMRGTVPAAKIDAKLRAGLVPGAFDIVLANGSDIDMPLPARVDVSPDCTFGDGVNGFTLAHERHLISLRRLQIGMLRAHHEQAIGWTRCRGNVRVVN